MLLQQIINSRFDRFIKLVPHFMYMYCLMKYKKNPEDIIKQVKEQLSYNK